MPYFNVRFFKNLHSSDGHPFKVLQRVIEVPSETPEEAITAAQQEFARREGVSHWRLHADLVEASTKLEAA